MAQPQLNRCALLFFLILAFQFEPVPESTTVLQLITVLFGLSCLGLRKRRIRIHFPRLRTGLVQNNATGANISGLGLAARRGASDIDESV